MVSAGPVMSLLFLNNNLHHTHHARPGVPWYGLPGRPLALDGDGAPRGAGLYAGYGDVARRYLFRPFDGSSAHAAATPSDLQRTARRPAASPARAGAHGGPAGSTVPVERR